MKIEFFLKNCKFILIGIKANYSGEIIISSYINAKKIISKYVESKRDVHDDRCNIIDFTTFKMSSLRNKTVSIYFAKQAIYSWELKLIMKNIFCMTVRHCYQQLKKFMTIVSKELPFVVDLCIHCQSANHTSFS